MPAIGINRVRPGSFCKAIRACNLVPFPAVGLTDVLCIDTPWPSHRTPRVEAKGTIPLGCWGESEEIAAAVRFLCGPGGGFITGQTIHVNGGQMMFA